MPRILMLLLMAAGVATAQQLATRTDRGSGQNSLPNNLQLRASLKSKLDSKKAKAGDKVKLVVLEEVRGGDNEVLLRKGTELRGRVTLAVPFQSATAPARLSLVVETAQGKDGPATLSAFISGGVELAMVETVDAKRKPTDSTAGPGSVKCSAASYGCNRNDVGQWNNGPDVPGATPVKKSSRSSRARVRASTCNCLPTPPSSASWFAPRETSRCGKRPGSTCATSSPERREAADYGCMGLTRAMAITSHPVPATDVFVDMVKSPLKVPFTE